MPCYGVQSGIFDLFIFVSFSSYNITAYDLHTIEKYSDLGDIFPPHAPGPRGETGVEHHQGGGGVVAGVVLIIVVLQ